MTRNPLKSFNDWWDAWWTHLPNPFAHNLAATAFFAGWKARGWRR